MSLEVIRIGSSRVVSGIVVGVRASDGQIVELAQEEVVVNKVIRRKRLSSKEVSVPAPLVNGHTAGKVVRRGRPKKEDTQSIPAPSPNAQAEE